MPKGKAVQTRQKKSQTKTKTVHNGGNGYHTKDHPITFGLTHEKEPDAPRELARSMFKALFEAEDVLYRMAFFDDRTKREGFEELIPTWAMVKKEVDHYQGWLRTWVPLDETGIVFQSKRDESNGKKSRRS